MRCSLRRSPRGDVHEAAGLGYRYTWGDLGPQEGHTSRTVRQVELLAAGSGGRWRLARVHTRGLLEDRAAAALRFRRVFAHEKARRVLSREFALMGEF